MDLDEYQKRAATTAQYVKDDPQFILMYLSMGLAGEVGETIEKVKKVVRNNGGTMTDETRDSIARELGDVLWYLSQVAKELGVPLSQVGQWNLEKLADR